MNRQGSGSFRIETYTNECLVGSDADVSAVPVRQQRQRPERARAAAALQYAVQPRAVRIAARHVARARRRSVLTKLK